MKHLPEDVVVRSSTDTQPAYQCHATQRVAAAAAAAAAARTRVQPPAASAAPRRPQSKHTRQRLTSATGSIAGSSVHVRAVAASMAAIRRRAASEKGGRSGPSRSNSSACLGCKWAESGQPLAAGQLSAVGRPRQTFSLQGVHAAQVCRKQAAFSRPAPGAGQPNAARGPAAQVPGPAIQTREGMGRHRCADCCTHLLNVLLTDLV